MTDKNQTCYVTGDTTKATNAYYFGSEFHTILDLSQEAFAHFVIRSGKDVMHKQIMNDIDNLRKKQLDFSKKYPKMPPINSEEYIDATIEAAILTDKVGNLLTQKAESGIRILRQMKKEFEQTGKLTS